METVSDTTRISVLLQKLQDQRSLVTIKVQDQAEPFSSVVIDVDRDAGLFIIDELKPDSGNELLRQRPALQIQGHLDGVLMNFGTTVVESGVDNGICYHKIAIPSEIQYQQRRQAVRVRLSAANPLAVTFTSASGSRYEGELEDLSVGGLRARFTQRLADELAAGIELNCSFALPPDKHEKINSTFIIRVIKHQAEDGKPPFLGGQFVALDKQAERKLQRAIMTLQRALRQKEAL